MAAARTAAITARCVSRFSGSDKSSSRSAWSPTMLGSGRCGWMCRSTGQH